MLVCIFEGFLDDFGGFAIQLLCFACDFHEIWTLLMMFYVVFLYFCFQNNTFHAVFHGSFSSFFAAWPPQASSRGRWGIARVSNFAAHSPPLSEAQNWVLKGLRKCRGFLGFFLIFFWRFSGVVRVSDVFFVFFKEGFLI